MVVQNSDRKWRLQVLFKAFYVYWFGSMTILPKTRYSLGKLGLFRYKVLIDKILVKYCPMFGSQISHIQIYHTPSDNSTCPFSSYIHNNQLICNSYHSNRFHLVSCTQQARQSLFRSFYLLFLPFFFISENQSAAGIPTNDAKYIS